MSILSKSLDATKFIPDYRHQITENIITVDGDKTIITIKIGGIPFETCSDDELENFFIKSVGFFNSSSKGLASRLAVWTHLEKKKSRLETNYKFPDTFMREFSKKYLELFEGEDFFKINYYITFVYQESNIDAAIQVLNDLASRTVATFRNADAKILGLVERNGGIYSEQAEFLSRIYTGHDAKIPLSKEKISSLITSQANLHYGYDACEIRQHESETSKFSICYDLSAYPADSFSGMWNFLLESKCEFLLSQSYIYSTTSKAIKKIADQINKLVSGNDGENTQLDELEEAKGKLNAGLINLGDYHAALKVFGSTYEEAKDNGVMLASDFAGLGNQTIFTRSNFKSVYTSSSMMPASRHRPLSTPKTTFNLVSGFSLNNYSLGKKTGNPIGDGTAIIPLKTKSDNIYYFNSHYSDKNKDVRGEKIAGHTLILGMTGAGKTTLEGTLVGFITRFNPKIFAIDFNRSTELFIRAYGGEYFTFKEGEKTGINPFQLTVTPKLKIFLYDLVGLCGADENGKINTIEEDQIKKAVDTTLTLDKNVRRFSTLLQSIPNGSDLKIRLSKWCDDGKFSWVFDCPENKFNPENYDRIGFDTTEFLNVNNPVCEPILNTLFFLKDLMQDKGNLMVTIVEEFWMPANFPSTSAKIKSILKAGRLKNEFIYLVSQSPEDAVKCAIFEDIVQQTPTKIFLPNPDAAFDGYSKCGLTKKEFKKLKELDKESRTFLIKQSSSSVFAKMDLYGFDDFLPIISGSSANINLCEKIREIHGDDPEIWIPLLREKIKEDKEKDNSL